MRSAAVAMLTLVSLVGGPCAAARAQTLLLADGLVAPPAASLSQAGRAAWQVTRYGDSPTRELSLNLSMCDASAVDGPCGGVTYTRNVHDGVALEAIADFGIGSQSEYDLDQQRYHKVGGSHPFGLVIAQLRAGRERLPGFHEFMTVGVARIFADRDKLDVPSGRALSVGVGCRAAVTGDIALRFELQGLLFNLGLGARASAGVVFGFD